MKKLCLAFALFLATPAFAALDDYGTKSITSGTYCKDITRGEATAAVIISGTWTGTGTLQRNDGRLTPGTPTNAWGVNVATRIIAQTFTANATFLVPIAGASQVCVNLGGGPTGTMTIFVDLSMATFPGALAQVTDIGTLTNNNAAPGVNNMGVLPCRANAAAPSWTEGNQVLCSVDLSGNERIVAVGAVANDTTAIANGVETQPGVARAAPTAITAGRSEKVQQDTATGGVYEAPVATTNVTGFSNASISATASVGIKASAGNLYGFVANNGQATACFLQCVNSATAGTLGTAPIISFPLALATGTTQTVVISPIPLANFSTGIACGFSTVAGGASACGTASTATILYK